jgi:hypothetical protein
MYNLRDIDKVQHLVSFDCGPGTPRAQIVDHLIANKQLTVISGDPLHAPMGYLQQTALS